MNYENILVEVDGQLAKVVINRPKVMNALNRQTLTELDHALSELGANDDVRCVLVTGAGDKAFVAGADINELAKMQALGAKKTAAFGQSVFARLENLGKPTIAMVNGFALGGGLELAMACTLRTASTC